MIVGGGMYCLFSRDGQRKDGGGLALAVARTARMERRAEEGGFAIIDR